MSTLTPAQQARQDRRGLRGVYTEYVRAEPEIDISDDRDWDGAKNQIVDELRRQNHPGTSWDSVMGDQPETPTAKAEFERIVFQRVIQQPEVQLRYERLARQEGP